jgi:hypothetical protein
MELTAETLTFIVRLTRCEGGALSGVVERARSGEKQRVHDITALPETIAEMVEREVRVRRRKESRQ